MTKPTTILQGIRTKTEISARDAGSLRDPCGILAGSLRDSCGILAGFLRANSFQLFPKPTLSKSFQNDVFIDFYDGSTRFPNSFQNSFPSQLFPTLSRERRGTPTRIPQGFRKDPARIPHPLREFSFWCEFFARYLSVFQFFLRSQLFPTLSHLLAFGPLKFSPKFPHPNDIPSIKHQRWCQQTTINLVFAGGTFRVERHERQVLEQNQS